MGERPNPLPPRSPFPTIPITDMINLLTAIRLKYDKVILKRNVMGNWAVLTEGDNPRYIGYIDIVTGQWDPEGDPQ